MARVQVQDLPDAPGLQPTVRSGGQYGVAVQQAGRNKLMDLADALSTVNPMLKDFTAIRVAERDYQRELGERAFDENPEEAMKKLEAGRSKAKAGIRSAVNKGIIDEYSNPDFQAGIMAAKGKVSAKQFRRALLTDPEALRADDPIAYVREKTSEFYQGIDSNYVRLSVEPILKKTADEYVNYVIGRQQDEAIAQGKIDWLSSIQDEAKAWTSNKFDLNDASFKEWIDDGAGSFKGSHKYAFDNMFKPLIRDMVERGNTAGALKKLQELKNWKISDSGAKFANSELLDDLNTLERTVLQEGEYFTNLSVTAYNRQRDEALSPFEAEFQARLNDDVPITDFFFKDWASRAREELTTAGVKANDVEKFIASQREEANKSYNRESEYNVVTDADTLGSIRSMLNLGIDQKEAINQARDNGELTTADYKSLMIANGDETDFEKNIMSRPSVRGYSDIIENRFSNVAVQGGIATLFKNSTNIVKDLTGYSSSTAPDVPAVALQTLGNKAEQTFRNELRDLRKQIITANPEISRPELDRVIDERTEALFTRVQEKIEADTLASLKTGNFNLGFSKRDVEKFLEGTVGTETRRINDALNNLGIPLSGKNDFLEKYKNNHF
jgi:hypothetical protein